MRHALVVVLVVCSFACRPSPFQTSAPPGNPTTATFTAPDHATTARYELDVVSSAGAVVQTVVIPAASTTAVGEIVTAPIALYPLDPGTYTSVVRAVAIGPAPSPDNSRLPPAPSLLDTELGVWTIGANLRLYRNDVDTGGIGSVLLWHGGAMYTLGTDNNWYQYVGTGWVLSGATDPAGGASAVPGSGFGQFASSLSSGPSNAWTRAPIAVF